LLALSRVDGVTTDVPLQVLPPNPVLDRAARRVNVGEKEQTVTLTGSGLDRIESVTCDHADLVLGPAVEDGTQRSLTVRLHADAKAGAQLMLFAKVQDIPDALPFQNALQVIGPRPRILEAKASLPADLPMAPLDGEIPAGFWVSFAIKVDPPDAPPTMTLQCAEASRTAQLDRLHVGEKHSGSQLLSASDGAVFLSLDPGSVGQAGCTLTEGARQTLRVVMPWPSPSPKAPLYLWLRGETAGRATTVTP